MALSNIEVGDPPRWKDADVDLLGDVDRSPLISIIICSHNPRPEYLRRVLDALNQQFLAKERWELLQVDNASRSELAKDWDLSWHPNARHVREEELGIGAARQRGLWKAKADLVVFVDDDNVLSCDYLNVALQIERAFPTLGTWGAGSIVPEFEHEPPKHLKPFLCYLALRDNKQSYWSNVITCHDSLPVGAGLCVRRQVASEYLNLWKRSSIRIIGRKGSGLLGHEDYEICLAGCKIGLGMGVFPELRVTHLIRKERTSDEYFLRLLEGSQISGLLFGGGTYHPRLSQWRVCCLYAKMC